MIVLASIEQARLRGATGAVRIVTRAPPLGPLSWAERHPTSSDSISSTHPQNIQHQVLVVYALLIAQIVQEKLTCRLRSFASCITDPDNLDWLPLFTHSIVDPPLNQPFSSHGHKKHNVQGSQALGKGTSN